MTTVFPWDIFISVTSAVENINYANFLKKNGVRKKASLTSNKEAVYHYLFVESRLVRLTTVCLGLVL